MRVSDAQWPDDNADGWMPIVGEWLATFDEVAAGLIEGLYVVGSAALGDWHAGTSDVDIIAVTAEPADDETSGILRTAHAVFMQRFEQARVDGPFLAWGDLTVAPHGVSRPWTLDGIFHHDAECFEINPVTWFTLARYSIAVRGTQPRQLQIPPDVEGRVRFVVDNAAGYWTAVHAELKGALGELGPDDTLPSSVPIWCLLGVCRMLYTATTGDVTSKAEAGRWAAGVLGDEFAPACELARRLRFQPEQPVGVQALRDTSSAMGEVLRRLRIIPR